MIVWKSGDKYWSHGLDKTEPFIGELEELPDFVQNAIAILHIAGEEKHIDGIGMWKSDKYSVVLPKETS